MKKEVVPLFSHSCCSVFVVYNFIKNNYTKNNTFDVYKRDKEPYYQNKIYLISKENRTLGLDIVIILLLCIERATN